ncbi:polymorphic toxin-type HINT domain-containing protein [Gimesia sp.]|uniref:polymorphic toxin-type HINT domain-containing protein n=1 Tax=Gimesia sp. TaxID=2024833 RepID=UPI003A8DC4E4
MSEITRKIAICGCLLFTSFCFWKAGTELIGDADTEILPSAHAAMSPSISPSRVVTTPIQKMWPGMRVVGRNLLRLETEATIDPTPEGWRLVSVRMLKSDGSDFEAELLRPLSWIRRHRARPGAMIELNMPELHVVGAAEVLSVSACPPIDPGDGPVVLSTFKNIANNILNIYVEGETEPIGVTAGHPIWSEDRQAFVHSDQLQPGERLRSALGKTVRITSIEIRAGPEPVYNLEVAGEYVYSVTDSGLLVHNTCPEVPGLYVFDEGSRSARLISSKDIIAPKGARGSATAWDGFDEALAGGPVRDLTTNRIKVTNRGIDVVEHHISRFGTDKANSVMVDRLRRIAKGKLTPSAQDLNIYSHELREFVRYRRLGWKNGVPVDGDARRQLWLQTHSATLDDYSLSLQRDDLLYHSDALLFLYE